MRLKQKIALMLTGIVLSGVVGMINPMEVKAEQSPQSYTKENGEILSVNNLGSPTIWNFNGTDYELYNEFIPFTSYSTGIDAAGFVKVLNNANYDGHNDWQLLDPVDMARAWVSDFPDILHKGGIELLWMAKTNRYRRYTVERDGIIGTLDKTIEAGFSNLGFVVLRPASKDASLTGSVLSDGSLWIIIGVVVVAAIAIIILVLAKKKQGKSK